MGVPNDLSMKLVKDFLASTKRKVKKEQPKEVLFPSDYSGNISYVMKENGTPLSNDEESVLYRASDFNDLTKDLQERIRVLFPDYFVIAPVSMEEIVSYVYQRSDSK